MTRFFYLLATVFALLASLPASAAATLGITAVYPTFVVQGTKGVPVAVVGKNFTPGSVVLVNGKPETTTVQGSTMAFFTLPVTPASVQVIIRAANGAVSKSFPLKVITSPTAPKSSPVVPAPGPVSTPAPTPAPAGPAHATWYVRPDGGTRYSANVTTGQCNGTANAAYSGTGTNQNCAFNDVRDLWTDGGYCGDNSATSSCWKWIGTGGDTYMILGSIGDGVTYRVGDSGPGAYDDFGLSGNPYGAGAPVPLSGTASAHTKILGGNYLSCSAQTARTQLHGGYGVGSVLNMSGAAYVDVACLDITDFSACGRAGQTTQCHTGYPIDDYAGTGITWSNKSTNDTITDVRIHGMAVLGMDGPTGDGVVMKDIALIGNAGAGWNADPGDGTTGTGALLVQNYNISWNGCAEEYPIVDGLPYQQCTDDGYGGYGDGFGTATVVSSPGWQVHFDQGTVSYNTQDGLDALHLLGTGSSMTVTRTLAFGNMGQQIKVGGASGTAQNNVIVTNCNAMRQPIPGTPAGYNRLLSDYCRAADAGIVLSVGPKTTLFFDNNTLYSDSATAIEIDCDTSNGNCDSTTLVDFRNNIFMGFMNNNADGYVSGGSGDYSNPIYNGTGYGEPYVDFFGNAGSQFSNNLTMHPKSNWSCPAAHETNASCGVDPGLTDETWHVYGYPNTQPLPTSSVFGRGVAIPSVTTDILGQLRSGLISVGAYQK